MGRKRKIPIPSEEKENEEDEQLNDAPENIADNGPIRVIMSKIQLNETCHNKYIKELSQVYTRKEQLKYEMKELADKLIQSKLDPHTARKVIDFKDMLDGIFNPTSKRPTGCLDSDYDEEEETEAGTYGTEHSRDQEQGTQPSSTDNATINKPTEVQETTEHTGADKPNEEDSILTADGDPSVCIDAPTTFGSDNNTSHRFLRKSLNASRNNSIESYPETIHDIQRPNKIRIEARIDSDKKSNGVAGNSAQSNVRATRSLTLAQRTQKIQTQNSTQANNKRENKKMQEPKIIEKIINPKQLNSAVQHKSGKKYQKPSTPREARNLAGDKARGNDEEQDNASEKDSIGAEENASNSSIRYSQDVDGSSQQKPGRKIQKSLGPLEVSDSLRNKDQDNGGGKENAEVDNSSQHKPEGKSHKSLGPEKVSDALRNKHLDNGGGRENTRKKVSASEREQREKNSPEENVRLTRSRKITKENNAEKEKQDNSKKKKPDFEATRDNEADKEVQQIFENASDRLRHMANRINIDESNTIVISSDEEVNTSEIIPPSPEAISSSSVLRVRTRKLRVNLCQSKGNTTDLSTARPNSRTPLRSGRKRVLRTSPRLLVAASSALMRSPPRKQQRTEIALKKSTVTRTQTKESVTKVSSLPISLRRKESRKDTCGVPTTSRQKQKDNIDGTSPKRTPAMMTRSASKKLVTTKWRLPLRRVSSRTSRQSLIKRSHIPVSAQFGAKRTQTAISASEKLNNNNNVQKENEEDEQLNDAPENIADNGPIRVIMSKIQLNETCHNKYIKELSQVYTRMDHDGFIYTFVKMIKTAMGADETNEYANMTLMFCAKFITSFEGEETHPVMIDVFRWLLTTISYNPNIRFRLCQFVNLILNALGQEATLDDPICDSIMEYMVGRCVDVSPNVRVQAILAMQRLQVPDNPDDAVLRVYQYHLCSDPSPRVRQTVITCMGRNYHTIPYILDRLSDIDEKVRRHTYLHMSSYPVRSYKVSQRLTLLEQGLNDRSDCVRKVVTNIMLQQWIESYQKNLVALIEALKLDSSPAEIDRFRKISRQALKDIFKRQDNADLVSCLVLETEGDFYRCVPHEKLTMEMTLYWQCLVEYFQADMAEELDLILPELSTFCAYVETYCQTQKDEMDKFELMEFQYKLLSLVEILYSFDLGDEIGRGNLQKLLAKLVTNFNLNEKVIEVMIRCSENLLTDQNARHQFFLDIIHDICGLNGKQQDLVHDRHLISELLANSTDAQLNLKLSSLKVKILDLEEQEMNFAQQKDSVRVQQIVEEKNMATEEFTILLQPLLERYNGALSASAQPQFSKVVKSECILRSLQIAFHMVVSKRVTSLGHATCRLYHDFIFRHIASNQISIRDWALKCAAAFSMHYEPLAKDVFSELYSQFFRNHNIRIWETAITCIFELLDIYGVENFVVQDEQNKSKKAGRQLYTTLEFVDGSEDEQLSTTLGQGVGVIYMMSHFLDTCEDACIVSAIVNGFCRLILHGQIDNRDIMEKLLSRYFNPSTEPEINQILGIFLENLIQSRKQAMLQVCIMATINSILSAPYDSPLHDIRPDTITRFIIDATRPDPSANKNEENIHNQLALTFLNEMVSNANNKELCKLLAKELLTLEVNVQKEQLKNEMKELADKLIQSKFDPHTTKKIIDFKDMLDGIFNPTSKRPTGCLDSDYDEEEETEAGSYGTEHSRDQEKGTQPSSTDNATINKPTGVQETTEHTGADKPNEEDNILTADGNPSVCTDAPTTFGSDNNTSHRFLRKSLNASRNNSIESYPETIEDIQRPNKIRIEARIDSDKKANSVVGNSAQSNVRATRSLRLAQRTFSQRAKL
uniref:Nuclear condensin complex subunit 3 C-terminal domain-containing protein n=1 Tax=Glossina morsitans morsitans TaxID=37546 RepID=A0A1B0GBP7_GLOMM